MNIYFPCLPLPVLLLFLFLITNPLACSQLKIDRKECVILKSTEMIMSNSFRWLCSCARSPQPQQLTRRQWFYCANCEWRSVPVLCSSNRLFAPCKDKPSSGNNNNNNFANCDCFENYNRFEKIQGLSSAFMNFSQFSNCPLHMTSQIPTD